MVTSISEWKCSPMAFSASARAPALGLSRCRYGEAWDLCLRAVNRVPSAKFITLVGTRANFSQARRVASASWVRSSGCLRSSALPWRFMNGKSSAHQARPITGT